MPSNKFAPPWIHYDCLVEAMPKEERALHDHCRNVRVEQVLPNDQLVVYTVVNGRPRFVDHVSVSALFCDKSGTSGYIFSQKTAGRVILDFLPRRLFDYPIFVSLPLDPKLRWMAEAGNTENGAFQFPLVIRTSMRRNLRGEGHTYLETEESFFSEFDTKVVA